MTAVAKLMDPDFLCGVTCEDFRLHGLLDLGRWPIAGPVPYPDTAHACVPAGLQGLRLDILALDWLLAGRAAREAMPPPLSDLLGRQAPFGPGTPTSGELAAADPAGVIVPLSSSCSPPQVALLVVVPGHGADQSGRLAGGTQWTKRKGVRIFVFSSAPNAAIEGRSWRLGAELACRCVESPSDLRVRQSLLQGWIVTGDVDDRARVLPVEMGNKHRLPRVARRWMLPPQDTLPPDVAPRPRTCVSSVADAWNVITECGTVEEGAPRPWPSEPVEYHSFVSSAIEPLVAGAILSRAPTVVLWQTPNEAVSRAPARTVRQVLARLSPGITVQTENTASDRMASVERVLRQRLSSGLRSGGLVLFNVTQGNRLMGFAVHTLARQHSNLWMVYRDNDCTDCDFVAVRYDDRDYPSTFVLHAANEDLRPDINWPLLLKPSPPVRPPEPPEAFVSRITLPTPA